MIELEDANSGWGLAHYAASEGHVECIRELARLGADLNKQSGHDCSTPLFVAARLGRTEAVCALVELGADISGVDSNGFTPLSWAAHSGRVEVVSALVKIGADVNKASAIDGGTPISYAAASGNHDIVRALVCLGADPSAAGHQDLPPLLRAYYDGRAVVATMLAVGAEADGVRNDELDPGMRELNDVLLEAGYPAGPEVDRDGVWACGRHPLQLSFAAALEFLVNPNVFDEINLAFMCGDFIMLTPERRRHYEREKRRERERAFHTKESLP